MNKRLGKVRVIGGSLRGTRVPVGEGYGLRPTTDRIKETLFNWLALDIDGARCLDLFAGTGSLGLECISRGAMAAVFVEKNQHVAEKISSLLIDLQIAVAEVLVQDATSYLKSCNTQFDIVFIDPPFKSGLVLPTLHALAKSNLAPGGMVYAEFSRGELVLPSDWQKLKSGMTKNVEFCLLVRR